MKKPTLKVVKFDPSSPHSALRRKARSAPMPASYREPRYLTEKQLKNPLIRGAHQRLTNMTTLRGKYLRELDRVNGDRRTRIEKFRALEAAAEQLLVRLDLATSTLGYLDDATGRYVLNTQRHIAEDSVGLSEAVLSRLLGTLDEAGYVKRRIEKIRLDEKDQNGLHLVRTRVLVQFTMKFWADLGLRYVFVRVQHAAMKKRQAHIRIINQRRFSEIERHSQEQARRHISRERWQAKEARDRRAEGHAEEGSSEPPQRANELKQVTGAGLQGALDKLQRSINSKKSNSA